MTRRIIKKGELVVDADSCIGKTIPDGSDDDDDDPRDEEDMIRNKKKKESPPVSGEISPTSSDNEEDKKEQAPSEGGQASDADTEASEETKFLPDKWLLTRDVLIRVHNKPRKELFTPNEDPDDPSPLPIRWLDIMRRTQTSCPTKAEAIIEDFWVNPNTEHRELSENGSGALIFTFAVLQREKGTNGRAAEKRASRKLHQASKCLCGRLDKAERPAASERTCSME